MHVTFLCPCVTEDLGGIQSERAVKFLEKQTQKMRTTVVRRLIRLMNALTFISVNTC